MFANEYDEGFGNATLYYTVFKDAGMKKRLFGNVNEPGEADPALRSSLLVAYFEMDAFSGEPEELKNSPSDQPQ